MKKYKNEAENQEMVGVHAQTRTLKFVHMAHVRADGQIYGRIACQRLTQDNALL